MSVYFGILEYFLVFSWCPNYVGSEKNHRRFFFHPPVRPPGPLEGGLCPDPRGPPPGGVPPKKGVAPPRAKNREKSAILGAQYAKNGHFGAKNGHFWANFDHF